VEVIVMRRLLPAVLLVGLSLPLLGVSAVLAQSPSQVPGSSPDVAIGIPSGEPVPVPGDDGATVAVPNPDLLNPQPAGWDHIVVAPDGRSLTVYFWSGVPECYGLQRVDVTPAAGGVDIQLYIGTVPPGNQVCIEIAQLYKVEIQLEAPVIGGGVAG
jgi:hypothetical protein